MKKKDQAYKGSRLEEIVLRYESALQEGRSEYFDVDDIEALIDYYMEDEQVATAQTITEFGLSLHPNNTNLKIAQAKIDLFIGHVKESEEIAAFLQTLEPDNLDIKVLVGQLLLFRGKKEEAKVLFDDVIRQDADYTYDVAYAYFDTFDYDTALLYFEQEIKLHPIKDELDVLFDMAYCHQQRNDLEKSINLYEKLLDEDPYSKDAWFNLGQIHFFNENLEKAIEAFDYAFIVGNDYQALLQKGNALFQSGKLQSAIEAYQEYADNNGRPPFVIVFIGECYEKTGQFEKAKSYYTEALRTDVNNTNALCGMCICHMEQDEYEKGIQFIDRAIEIEPTLAEAWLYKAEGHLNLNDTDEALRCYKKAASLDPEMAEALFAIGNIYIDKGEYAMALQYYKKGAEIDRGAEKADLYFAISYFKLGEIEQAHDHLIEAVLRVPESKEIFFEICPEAKEHIAFISLFKAESNNDNAANGINSYFSNL